MILWTFSKDYTEILIVYDAQIPRNDITSGTILYFGLTNRRISFDVSNAEVLLYTIIIKE